MEKNALRKAAERYKQLIMPPYDSMMDLDGFEAIYAFAQYYSGCRVYVPGLRTIFSECIEKEIMRTYNGRNMNALVRSFGCSERFIRQLISNTR